MYYYGDDINKDTQDRTVEALTIALLDAQEQHRKDAATIDYLVSRIDEDEPKIGGTDE